MVKWKLGDKVVEKKLRQYGPPPVGIVVVSEDKRGTWSLGVKYPNDPDRTYFVQPDELERA